MSSVIAKDGTQICHKYWGAGQRSCLWPQMAAGLGELGAPDGQTHREPLMTVTATFATKDDLSIDMRQRAIQLLNQQLADTFDLYGHTK